MFSLATAIADGLVKADGSRAPADPAVYCRSVCGNSLVRCSDAKHFAPEPPPGLGAVVVRGGCDELRPYALFVAASPSRGAR